MKQSKKMYISPFIEHFEYSMRDLMNGNPESYIDQNMQDSDFNMKAPRVKIV